MQSANANRRPQEPLSGSRMIKVSPKRMLDQKLIETQLKTKVETHD